MDVQWLGHQASTAGAMSSISGLGTKILPAIWYDQKRGKRGKKRVQSIGKHLKAPGRGGQIITTITEPRQLLTGRNCSYWHHAAYGPSWWHCLVYRVRILFSGTGSENLNFPKVLWWNLPREAQAFWQNIYLSVVKIFFGSYYNQTRLRFENYEAWLWWIRRPAIQLSAFWIFPSSRVQSLSSSRLTAMNLTRRKSDRSLLISALISFVKVWLLKSF